jgi:hypothetical protein
MNPLRHDTDGKTAKDTISSMGHPRATIPLGERVTERDLSHTLGPEGGRPGAAFVRTARDSPPRHTGDRLRERSMAGWCVGKQHHPLT